MRVQVLLPKIFNHPFTYNTNKIQTNLGDIVEVPFGTTNTLGVIWKNTYSEPKKIKIKNINKKIGKYSIDKKLINFIEWFSNYNMVPIGLVLKMVIGKNDLFIKKTKNIIKLKFKSKSFLKNQVRSMVGCLKYLGEGKWNLKKFENVFIKKDRKKVAPPAPAHGLYLEKIIY